MHSKTLFNPNAKIMKLKYYQIDAFAENIFQGNPAGVCPLDAWLEDELMQKIAQENNQAETAFFVKTDQGYHIRWFTPEVEVDLCGHATLASAYVINQFTSDKSKTIHFDSKSGLLSVSVDHEVLTLDFPSDHITLVDITEDMLACFKNPIKEAYRGKTDYMFVFESEAEILNLDFSLFDISKLEARGIIATAPGKDVDFVSRFFAPQSGVMKILRPGLHIQP